MKYLRGRVVSSWAVGRAIWCVEEYCFRVQLVFSCWGSWRSKTKRYLVSRKSTWFTSSTNNSRDGREKNKIGKEDGECRVRLSKQGNCAAASTSFSRQYTPLSRLIWVELNFLDEWSSCRGRWSAVATLPINLPLSFFFWTYFCSPVQVAAVLQILIQLNVWSFWLVYNQDYRT